MLQRVQLVSDLSGLIRSAKGSSLPIDLGTLVGTVWGLGSVSVDAFETAVAAVIAVPAEDTLLKLTGTSLQFLDSATGTVEYAVLEVPAIEA